MTNPVEPTNKTALITGASGGIGLELAKLFARDRFNLVLVARSRDKLDQLAAELSRKYDMKTLVIAKDLSDHNAPQEVYDEVVKAGIDVDILVNNAGYTMLGKFVELGVQEQMQMAQVNIMTLTHLTRLFLPGMVERGYGNVLNVASTAAFQPGPLMAVYYASKAYVLSFSEAIGNELRGTGVTVTVLCPGPTRTGFQSRGGVEGARLLRLGAERGQAGPPRQRRLLCRERWRKLSAA